MEMEYGLARRRAAIDTDIVAVGPVVLLDDGLRTVDRLQERGALLVSRVEPGWHMAVGD